MSGFVGLVYELDLGPVLGCCSGAKFKLPEYGYMANNTVSGLWHLNLASLTATKYIACKAIFSQTWVDPLHQRLLS